MTDDTENRARQAVGSGGRSLRGRRLLVGAGALAVALGVLAWRAAWQYAVADGDEYAAGLVGDPFEGRGLVELLEQPRIVFFSAAPGRIEAGQSASISFLITGSPYEVTLNGVQVPRGGGALVVTPAADTPYTLHARSPLGLEAEARLGVGGRAGGADGGT